MPVKLAMPTPAMAAFDRLDRATLQTQAYQQLRKAVMGGAFSPGAVITIRAAAEALGVSPMPVRAALQRLEAEGALVARGSKRTLGIPDLAVEEYRQLRDIRIALEGLAAERAAEHIRPDELAGIERNCQAMQTAADGGDLDGYVRANWAFHLSIYRASRMETLVSLIESLWLRVGPYVKFMMPDQRSLAASMPDHWSAFRAIERRDGAGARKAIVDDIGHSAVTLIKMLADQ